MNHSLVRRWMLLAIGALFLSVGLGCSGRRGVIDLGESLQERLDSPHATVRREALLEMTRMGRLTEQQLARVVNSLTDADAEVRLAGARAIVSHAAAERAFAEQAANGDAGGDSNAATANTANTLADRLAEWAAKAGDAHCRELIEQAAVGRLAEPGETGDDSAAEFVPAPADSRP